MAEHQRKHLGPEGRLRLAGGLAMSIVLGATGPVAGRAKNPGGLEELAIEVRAFIDSVVGGIETLQIPTDIHDLPQPHLRRTPNPLGFHSR